MLLAWQTWSASLEEITAIFGLRKRVTKSFGELRLGCCCSNGDVSIGVEDRDESCVFDWIGESILFFLNIIIIELFQ